MSKETDFPVIRSITTSYPIYILVRERQTKIIFPLDKEDIGHSEFWETIASYKAAKMFEVPQRKLVDLPYSQRRARIVDERVLYGERFSKSLLNKIMKAVGEQSLRFVYDVHERRLVAELIQFERLMNDIERENEIERARTQ